MVILRRATRKDIDGMHRVRLAVRENMLSSPTRIAAADYLASIEVKGCGWVIETDGEIIAFAVGHESDGTSGPCLSTRATKDWAMAGNCTTSWSTGYAPVALIDSG